MFKNLLKIDYKEKDLVTDMQGAYTWREKDIFYELLNRYIPNKIIEILPVDKDGFYIITWESFNSYQDLLIDKDYININRIFEKYEIKISWFDISAKPGFQL
jgi:hypothetical protein